MALAEKEKPASARTHLGTGESQEPDTLPSRQQPPHSRWVWPAGPAC